jgi:ubiquinone/menaquinone biosynthesis C-methylase UbiE
VNARAQEVSARIVTGNHFDKYRSPNPVHRMLMRGFLDAAGELVGRVESQRVLEIGCGPGDLAQVLFSRHGNRYVGLDVSPEEVEAARRRCPQLEFLPASAYRLPFRDGAFDLVVACEVLEHLEAPDVALKEIVRVCRGYVLASVPWEPVWSLLNVARGAYLSRLGNTPGHVQRFSRRAIRTLIRRHLDLVSLRRPFPWTMILARTRAH